MRRRYIGNFSREIEHRPSVGPSVRRRGSVPPRPRHAPSTSRDATRHGATQLFRIGQCELNRHTGRVQTAHVLSAIV